MKCSSCGQGSDAPLCERCQVQNYIAYLRENKSFIIKELRGTLERNIDSPDHLSELLFDQDMWFDLYPEEWYADPFFSSTYHEDVAEPLRLYESLIWVEILMNNPEYQAIVFQTVDGL